MERLPNELTDAIVKSLTTLDVCNFRLTCRKFADAAAPHLFPRVFLSSHPLDIQCFRTVIRNPRICLGIKELIWDDTTYCDSLMDKEKYMNTAKHTGSWGSWCIDLYPDQENEDGYRLFLEKSYLHHYIRRRRIDEKLLLRALPKLKNLSNIVLSSRHHYMPFPDDTRDIINSPTARQWEKERQFKTFTYPPTINWKTVREDKDHFEPTSKDLMRMMTVGFHRDMWDEQDIGNVSNVHALRPFRGFLILLRALSETKSCHIESFEIRPQYASKFGEDNDMRGISHYFFRRSSADLERFIAIVRCLRRLHLVISCEGSSRALHHPSAIDTIKRGNLTRALQAAEKLEELHLELPLPKVMKAIGPDTQFDRLKTLTLMQGVVEPLELLEFLKRHRSTVRSLSLSHCNSTSKSWADLFHHMKAEQLYLLIEVYFLFEPNATTWCRTMEHEDIDSFFTGNGPLPLVWFEWKSRTPPPRF